MNAFFEKKVFLKIASVSSAHKTGLYANEHYYLMGIVAKAAPASESPHVEHMPGYYAILDVSVLMDVDILFRVDDNQETG